MSTAASRRLRDESAGVVRHAVRYTPRPHLLRIVSFRANTEIADEGRSLLVSHFPHFLCTRVFGNQSRIFRGRGGLLHLTNLRKLS